MAPSEPKIPFSRETSIRRDAEGRWFHDGEPVLNASVARAFDRWVAVAEDGRFCLKNSVNWAYVDIEGPPLFVQRVRVQGFELEMELSDGTSAFLQPNDRLHERGEGQLRTWVRGGTMEAAFTRKAMFDLMPYVHENERGYWLELGERRWVVEAEPERAPSDPGASSDPESGPAPGTTKRNPS